MKHLPPKHRQVVPIPVASKAARRRGRRGEGPDGGSDGSDGSGSESDSDSARPRKRRRRRGDGVGLGDGAGSVDVARARGGAGETPRRDRVAPRGGADGPVRPRARFPEGHPLRPPQGRHGRAPAPDPREFHLVDAAGRFANVGALDPSVPESRARRRVPPYVRIDGDTPPSERGEAVDRFRRRPSCRVALVSITAGCVGIDLSAAGTVIFAELPACAADCEQAEDRAHRNGVRNPVNVYYLVARGPGATADERRWANIEAQLNKLRRAVDGEDLADERGLRPTRTRSASRREYWNERERRRAREERRETRNESEDRRRRVKTTTTLGGARRRMKGARRRMKGARRRMTRSPSPRTCGSRAEPAHGARAPPRRLGRRCRRRPRRASAPGDARAASPSRRSPPRLRRRRVGRRRRRGAARPPEGRPRRDTRRRRVPRRVRRPHREGPKLPRARTRACARSPVAETVARLANPADAANVYGTTLGLERTRVRPRGASAGPPRSSGRERGLVTAAVRAPCVRAPAFLALVRAGGRRLELVSGAASPSPPRVSFCASCMRAPGGRGLRGRRGRRRAGAIVPSRSEGAAPSCPDSALVLLRRCATPWISRRPPPQNSGASCTCASAGCVVCAVWTRPRWRSVWR